MITKQELIGIYEVELEHAKKQYDRLNKHEFQSQEDIEELNSWHDEILVWQRAIDYAQQLPDSERGECELIRDRCGCGCCYEVVCSKCGHKSSDCFIYAKFCENCGAKIERQVKE